MRFLKMNKREKENDRYENIVSIVKETEKAIQIKVETFKKGEPFDERLEWLPKSAIFIKDDWLGIEEWLAGEKGLEWAKAIVCNLDDEKLLAKKGWKLIQLTGEQRLVLLEEGLAILQ